jgi:hypothetical protein
MEFGSSQIKVAYGIYVPDVTQMTCAYHYIGSVTASMIVQTAWTKSTARHRKVRIVRNGEVALVINLVPHLEHIWGRGDIAPHILNIGSRWR